MAVPRRSPRTFASPGDVVRDVVSVARRARPLALANLSSNTFEGLLGRLGLSRPAEPRSSVP